MAGTIRLRMILMLIISFGLFVTVLYGQETDSYHEGVKKVDSKLVSIASDSSSVQIGDEIHVNGVIDPSLLGGGLSDTIILISAPDGSLADTFVLSSPDRHGLFDYSIPADVGGVWGFEALYNGINSQRVEIMAVPSDESVTTTLTLSGWPSYPKVGENVLFKGRLTDASGTGIPVKEIVYETAPFGDYSVSRYAGENPDRWSLEGSEMTDQWGEYQFTMTMEEEGCFDVRVVFFGDEVYHGCSSRIMGIISRNS